jgi:anti-sigma B factor antagonist
MKLALSKYGDVTVITVSGTITMLDSPSPLKQQVSALVQEGARKFVLSLGQLTFVDSSCVGELVSCYVRVARVNGTLKLSEVPRRINELLLVTQLNEIFETFEGDSAAVASFGSRGR